MEKNTLKFVAPGIIIVGVVSYGAWRIYKGLTSRENNERSSTTTGNVVEDNAPVDVVTNKNNGKNKPTPIVLNRTESDDVITIDKAFKFICKNIIETDKTVKTGDEFLSSFVGRVYFLVNAQSDTVLKLTPRNVFELEGMIRRFGLWDAYINTLSLNSGIDYRFRLYTKRKSKGRTKVYNNKKNAYKNNNNNLKEREA